ncbi:MAG: hypothetical protein ACSHYA_06230 [Opitutaceae bacterium]
MHTSKPIICLRVLFVILCSVAFIGSLNAQSTRDFDSDLSGVERLKLKESRGRLSGLERVLLLHLDAVNFGTDSSYVAMGSYNAQGQDLDLSMVGKRSDSFRMTFKKNSNQYVIILDGETFSNSNMKSKTDDYDLKEVRIMEIEGNFLMLTWAYEMSGLSGLELVDEVKVVNGSSCYRILNTRLDYMTIDHFIDIDNGSEVARHAHFEVNDTEYKIEMEYLPAESIGPDGSDWTGGFTMKINGEFHAEAKFDSVKRNTGVGSWMFKPTYD